MIAAALGFATIENLFVVLNVLGDASSLAVGTTAQTLLLRFVGATLLHTLTAGLIGYYWALGKLRNAVSSLLPLGIVLATIVHIVFNYLVFAFEDSNLFVPSLFLVVAAFFVLNDFEKLKRVNP
jgi:RsiW-degrading membrane proteinase PrsW (M82 family)